MKRLTLLLLLAVCALAGGCADPLEQRSTQDVQSQLQRGVTGQGQLGPEPRTPDDPAAQHAVPQDHP
ncbi:MAG: hypothetical protein JO354_11390 [Verrucomicrobia bacterium]|nr:hypothetical protein [Verrucomicrobiota bacterium]